MKNFNMTQFLFSFKGRTNRKPFWFFSVASGILIFIISNSIQAFVSSQGGTITPMTLQNIMNIVALFLLWPALAVQVKRWHDINKSGWFVLLSIIPVLGFFIVLIANGFINGTQGNNKYGADPLNRESPATKEIEN